MGSLSNGEVQADSTSWNEGEREGMVSIGTFSLFMSVAGPERKQGDPLVVVVQSTCDGCIWWKEFQRLAAQHMRICLYDRAGIGQSEASAVPRTAENIAQELQELLTAAQLPGPYLLVAHSYGGIIAREFLAQQAEEVAGMLFIDSEQEDTHKQLQVPWESLDGISEGLDYFEVSGLNAEHKLREEEWQALKEAEDSNKAAADAEKAESDTSCAQLAAKNQLKTHALHPRPVSVMKANSVRSFKRIYDAGVHAGNGTAEHRREMRDFLARLSALEEELQRALLELSPTNARFSRLDELHSVNVCNPQAIVDEVLVLLKRVKV